MSEQITVQEAKRLKQECEHRISELVHGFEQRTGYTVNGIELEIRRVGFDTSSAEFSRSNVKLITEVK